MSLRMDDLCIQDIHLESSATGRDMVSLYASSHHGNSTPDQDCSSHLPQERQLHLSSREWPLLRSSGQRRIRSYSLDLGYLEVRWKVAEVLFVELTAERWSV